MAPPLEKGQTPQVLQLTIRRLGMRSLSGPSERDLDPVFYTSFLSKSLIQIMLQLYIYKLCLRLAIIFLLLR